MPWDWLGSGERRVLIRGRLSLLLMVAFLGAGCAVDWEHLPPTPPAKQEKYGP